MSFERGIVNRDEGGVPMHIPDPTVAEANLAKHLVKLLEEHRRRFAEEDTAGFSIPNPDAITVVVLMRAAREFWHKHPSVWPRFSVSGSGVSVSFFRIPL